MLELLNTYQLITAFEEVRSAPTFLQMRYFGQTINYNASAVLAEYKAHSKKAAPFCIDRHNGIPVLRGQYDIAQYTPPLISLKRSMTADDLEGRGFGEALYAQLSPDQRQDRIFMEDLKDLDDMITRREEVMCAGIMLNNAVEVTEYADDLTVGRSDRINFYEGLSNPAEVDITTEWDDPDADILGDLSRMVEIKADAGQPVDDLVCSPDVARAIINNAAVKEMLDLRRYELGQVDPRLIDKGVALYAVLNIDGYPVNILGYGMSYEADDGTDTKYIPSGWCVLAHRDAGVRTYARVGEVEESDGRFHYYAAARVPKYWSSAQDNIRQLKLSSRPLPLVKEPNPFISAKVLDID